MASFPGHAACDQGYQLTCPLTGDADDIITELALVIIDVHFAIFLRQLLTARGCPTT